MHTMAAAEPQTQAPPVGGAAAASLAGGEAAAGGLVFRKCQACHSMEPGKALLGPSLAGIVGRKAGTEANYNYSPAMKQANIVWDAKALDAYLADPQKVVPGNMPFPGLKTEQDRADVIAFFAAAGGAQAVPAAPGNAPAPAREAPAAANQAAPQSQANQAPQAAPSAGVTYVPDANYTLLSGIAEGRMLARTNRPAAADRQARTANGTGRSCQRRS
jgi:nitrite reductase (NO-forming)